MRLQKFMLGFAVGALWCPAWGSMARASEAGPIQPVSAEIGGRADLPSRGSSFGQTIRIAQNASGQSSDATGPRNPANLSLQITPDQTVGLGTKISFRITAKKSGYVLLVDIDADGTMSQIFPSPEMIAQSQEAAANFVKPGQELLIPNAAAKKRGFEYIATPPLGKASVVAIFSERRVQILDLPDITQRQDSESEIIDSFARWINGLRLPDPRTGKLETSSWSLDVKRYLIKE